MIDFSYHGSRVRLQPEDNSEECSENLKLAFRSKKDFVIGVFWLVICILSSATIGPVVLMIPSKSTYCWFNYH